jgi:hypothetical protein
MRICGWQVTKITVADIFQLIMGMIKIRMPKDISKVMNKIITVELD